MKTYDRMQQYVDLRGFGSGDPVDDHRSALEFLCGELDTLRAELNEQYKTVSALKAFANEWEPKLKHIAERVLSADQRIAEVHKRLDQWDALGTRLQASIASFERVMKGETL